MIKRTCKLIFPLIFTLIFLSERSQAQVGIDLTGMYGYTFDDKFDIYEGHGKISDGGVITGILSFRINPKYDIELYYSNQKATFTFDSYYDYGVLVNQPIVEDATMQYLQLGGCRNQQLDANGRTNFFGGVNLGAGWITPESNKYDDIWKFAFGLKAGIKHMVSERVGIRIQTQLQVPVLYTSGSIWVGTGGTSVGMSAGSTITQFGFSGGLIFRLK